MKIHNLALGVIAAIALVSCTKNLEPLSETVTIDGSVGKLIGDVVRPEVKGEKCPVTIIYHGLTGWRTETHLTTLADSLHAHGVATVMFDFNGHGESDGRFVDMTLDSEIADAKLIYEYVASLPWVDTDNIAITGHSQGGLVTGVTAGDLGKDKIKCAALLAPAAMIHTYAISGDFFGREISEGNWPDSVYFSDGHYLGAKYAESAYYLDVFGRTAKYTGPACVVQGLNDYEDLIADAEKYPEYMEDCKYYPVPGLTHCFPEDYATPAKIATDFILKNFGMDYDPSLVD